MTTTEFRRWLKAQLPRIDPIYGILDDEPHLVLEVGGDLAGIVKQAADHAAALGYGDLVEKAEPLVGLCDVEKARAFLAACIERTQGAKPEFLTPPQAAKELGVNRGKVLNWIRSGELKADNLAEKRGGKPRWRIDRAHLEMFRATRQNDEPKATRPKKAIPPADVIRYF